MRIVLTFGTARKGLEYPQGSVDHTLRTAAIIFFAIIMLRKYS